MVRAQVTAWSERRSQAGAAVVIIGCPSPGKAVLRSDNFSTADHTDTAEYAPLFWRLKESRPVDRWTTIGSLVKVRSARRWGWSARACPDDHVGRGNRQIFVYTRDDLTDDQWAKLEPLLPDRTPIRGGRWMDHRKVIKRGAVADQVGIRVAGSAARVRKLEDGVQPASPLARGWDLAGGADRVAR